MMQEAGCSVIGGHSIGDEEMKFGYAVTVVVNLEVSGSTPRRGRAIPWCYRAPRNRGDQYRFEKEPAPAKGFGRELPSSRCRP